jgi:VIT1/CCC1 family predicted Fe2+/Mn2+ transporter
MSMAAGEYVSVSSQSDTETADLNREQRELREQPRAELDELAAIYIKRGVESQLARKVAEQMMRHDALGTHARDELGISEISTARPLQAAFTSALTFSAGAALPLLTAVLSPASITGYTVFIASLIALALLGSLAAKAGGAGVLRPTIRVTFWGAAGMAVTAAVGMAFGTVV